MWAYGLIAPFLCMHVGVRAHGIISVNAKTKLKAQRNVYLRNGLVIKSFQLHSVECGSSTVGLIVLGFGQCTILVFSQTIYGLNGNAD